MANYRCFFRDGDGKVWRMDRADHPDDKIAIHWGADLLRQNPKEVSCEVWEGDRLVKALVQKPTPPAMATTKT